MRYLPDPARAVVSLVLGTTLASACAQPDLEVLRSQVDATERSFARSMAERDHAAFAQHLSEQAVFFAPNRVLHGSAEVAQAWKRFFEGAQAPFAWEPDQVEVLADGTLAHSSGPVRDPAGVLIARFNSVWRQESPGVWRIVFDRGEEPTPQDQAREAARAASAAVPRR
jgi:ketosteroid isomerase-like protein